MIFIEQIVIPALSGDVPRRLFIHVPDELEEAEEEIRYPVLYMFDGHNLFYDKTATYGKCWGLKEYLEEHHTPLIVVGVECNHEGNRRLLEYSPYAGKGGRDPILEPLGKVTMDWLVQKCKPVIDENFPTLPDRAHTAIAGSSMGGLMALYGGTVYNQVFSRAACLSPCVSVDLKALLADIEACELGEDTRIYMDIGEHEAGKKWTRDLERTARLLFKKRALACLRIVPGGDHSEASWERQIPFFMRHLGLTE